MADEEVLDDLEEFERTESIPESSEEYSELKERCSSAEIPYEKQRIGATEFVYISMPCGRGHRNVMLQNLEDVQRIIAIPFENFVFLGDYLAICSYTDGTIEAPLHLLDMPYHIPHVTFYMRFLREGVRVDEEYQASDLERLSVQLRIEQDVDGIEINIGPRSEVLPVLMPHMYRDPFYPSLLIKGLRIDQHDQALDLLERITNSLFFQIDISKNLPLGLRKTMRATPFARRRLATREQEDLIFPQHEYDQAPMSLYWYGRSARDMPLLQFLAYYQAIEFYFPIYSQAEAQRKVRNILKDPSFRPERHADISKILNVVKGGTGLTFGDERFQLKATLQECLDSDDLRTLLTSDDNIREFFSSKTKGLTDQKIPINDPNADLRIAVADRIYDIRCKIVHTKSGGREGEVELLLPFSKEAQLLHYDIWLVQYIARQVLIVASSELRI
jgi:hypothetical protein